MQSNNQNNNNNSSIIQNLRFPKKIKIGKNNIIVSNSTASLFDPFKLKDQSIGLFTLNQGNQKQLPPKPEKKDKKQTEKQEENVQDKYYYKQKSTRQNLLEASKSGKDFFSMSNSKSQQRSQFSMNNSNSQKMFSQVPAGQRQQMNLKLDLTKVKNVLEGSEKDKILQQKSQTNKKQHKKINLSRQTSFQQKRESTQQNDQNSFQNSVFNMYSLQSSRRNSFIQNSAEIQSQLFQQHLNRSSKKLDSQSQQKKVKSEYYNFDSVLVGQDSCERNLRTQSSESNGYNNLLSKRTTLNSLFETNINKQKKYYNNSNSNTQINKVVGFDEECKRSNNNTISQENSDIYNRDSCKNSTQTERVQRKKRLILNSNLSPINAMYKDKTFLLYEKSKQKYNKTLRDARKEVKKENVKNEIAEKQLKKQKDYDIQVQQDFLGLFNKKNTLPAKEVQQIITKYFQSHKISMDQKRKNFKYISLEYHPDRHIHNRSVCREVTLFLQTMRQLFTKESLEQIVQQKQTINKEVQQLQKVSDFISTISREESHKNVMDQNKVSLERQVGADEFLPSELRQHKKDIDGRKKLNISEHQLTLVSQFLLKVQGRSRQNSYAQHLNSQHSSTKKISQASSIME